MADYGSEYQVGKTYLSSRDPERDEFQAWLNGPIDTGIQNSGGIRALANPKTGEREFLVFISDSSASQNQNPWEDIINLGEGTARYWGDARAQHSPDPDSANGNKWVKNDYSRTYAVGNRSEAPPVLLFEKPETGKVTFSGLCIITNVSIERHKDEGETVVNYLFDLAILDVDTVPLEWIHRKARTGVDSGGPQAWRDWVSEGRLKRYSIWSEKIRPKDDQYPSGQHQQLLDDIRSRLSGPQMGEKLEQLVKYILEANDSFQDIQVTPKRGDKGVDLTGKIDLLSDAQLAGADAKIDFKAQVKNRKSSISGNELSRLASRVEDGEIGLFFTTSHYTSNAQEENLSSYPVRLFAGRDLVDLLIQTDLVDGHTLADDVVDDIQDSIRSQN